MACTFPQQAATTLISFRSLIMQLMLTVGVSDTLVRSISRLDAQECWRCGMPSGRMLFFMLGTSLRLLGWRCCQGQLSLHGYQSSMLTVNHHHSQVGTGQVQVFTLQQP